MENKTQHSGLRLVFFSEAEHFQDALEIVGAIIFDLNTAFFIAMCDSDVGGEVALQTVLDTLHRWRKIGGGAARFTAWRRGQAVFVEKILHDDFRFANSAALADDHVGGGQLLFVILEAEEDFAVAHGKQILRKPGLNLGVEFEESQGIGDTGAAAPDTLRDVFLAKIEFRGQTRKSLGFVDGVEVGALEVFDESEFEHVAIGGLTDNNGSFGQAGSLRGPPAAFTGDQFKFRPNFANDEWLNDTAFFNGVGQFLERFFLEFAARLKRAGNQAANRNHFHAFSIADDRSWRGDFGGNQGSETFAECEFCHRGEWFTRGTCACQSTKHDEAMIFERLRLIEDLAPGDGAWNMAVDEMLTQEVLEPTLRVYRWSEPTVTLGYFEKIEEIRSLRPGMPLIRRWTGGGMVDHGEDWTYSLIIPAEHMLAKITRKECYVIIHRTLQQAIGATMGLSLDLAEEAEVTGEGCFARPVAGDLLLAGRKIAGAAQRRTRHALLHQGSIQLPAMDQLLPAILARYLAPKIFSTPLTNAEKFTSLQLVASRYSLPEWLARF